MKVMEGQRVFLDLSLHLAPSITSPALSYLECVKPLHSNMRPRFVDLIYTLMPLGLSDLFLFITLQVLLLELFWD